MSKPVAHVEYPSCGHHARLPVGALGERRGPALWRVLRCSTCGSLGKAEVRLTWMQEGNPLAAGHGDKPRERAS